ncbi:YIP1 family protein [Methanoplanus endosymbiosus]|uniref:YIP1 family protein n=1 Tax=Methanoplanus endosymbiosus TaxID=33865 RepID=A0A9E7PN85_9EURY|nr:YIP1 family protein [Methanoplanus endosymbiosus]UUX92006.1 YIP1 family protein [Methanoplanus endosymbiosus]
MLEDFPEKLKSFILSPTEAFRNIKNGDVGDALVYYVVLLVIYSVLSGIVNYFRIDPIMKVLYSSVPAGTVAIFDIMNIIYGIVGGIVGFFIIGLVLHLFVLIVGGKMGLEQTFKSVAYASTPGFLLGWIPVIGILFAFYGIIVQIIGIRELQEVSTGRATVAVMIPLIILFGLIILAVLFFVFAVVAATGIAA